MMPSTVLFCYHLTMARTARTSSDWEAARVEAIGEVLATARNRIRMTAKELAARTNVSESSIRKIEGGKIPNPGLFTVAALAIELRVDLSEALRSFTGPIRSGR